MAAKAADSIRETPARRGGGKLAQALAQAMGESLLPGDMAFEKGALAEAAQFTLDAAARRESGEPVVILSSAAEGRRFMRIALINDDMPFLVDSVAATVSARGLSIDRLMHPVVAVRRDASGAIEAFPEEGGEVPRESMIYIQTPRLDAKERRALEKDLAVTLTDVRAAVHDWPKLREAIRADADRIAGPDAEGAALLRWLEGGMLTQLGHVTRHRDGTHTNVLGICRKSAKAILADPSYERAFAWFDARGESAQVPLIVKANRMSNVHRRVPLDLFIVPVHEGGKLVALSIHAGVWTSASLATPPAQVPRLRAELAQLNDKFGFDPSGHAGKALVHALTALPHDLLIGFTDADIERVATTMMGLVDRPRPRLALVEAPLSRHLFAFVWMPRDMLSTQVRLRIEELLEEGAGAQALDWSLQVEGGNLALLRYVLDYRESHGTPDERAIELAIQTLLRGWGEAVESELAADEEPTRAAALAGRYAESFPT
ncbi:MAG: NAD-glutamate dehydrogenase, partial [Planctomycetes bacterium]|nr:NAD-glutamate dehydrogenase [Planctomycetota bacterium]